MDNDEERNMTGPEIEAIQIVVVFIIVFGTMLILTTDDTARPRRRK
jgi:hypothetical protein